MSKPRWTKDELRRLKFMRHRGYSHKRCAETIGRPVNGCRYMCQRLGIYPVIKTEVGIPDAYYEGMAAHPENPEPPYRKGTPDYSWYRAGWGDADMEVAA